MSSDCPIPHPEIWEVVSLSEICSKIGSGATPKGGQSTYLDARDHYAFIRSQNVFDRCFSNDGLAFISDDQAAGLKNVELQEDDLLLNITGDGITFARSCLVPASVLPACVNQHVSIIRVKPEIANPGYVLSYLTHKDIKPYIESFNAGGSRRAITKGHIESFRLALPPLEEQKAIANILGSLDDKIELNRQMNATLEGIAQALFKSWFVDFDPVIDNALAAGNPIPEPFQARAAARQALGDKRKPLPPDIQKLFGDRFVFNEDLGWIPYGWEVRTVEDAIQINPKVSLKQGKVAPFVDMKALPTSGFGISEVIQKEYSGGAKFQQDDVLLARITPCLENGKTGLVDFLEGTEVGFGSTEFIVMRGKKSLKIAFVACLSRHPAFRAHCELGMVGSSGRQRVQNSSFSDYFLALPSDDSLPEKFDRLASFSFEKMSASNNESKTLSKLRDTLLPKLLSGQIRIPDAEALVAEAI